MYNTFWPYIVLYEARAFNSDLSKWDTSSVTNMYKSTELFLLFVVVFMNIFRDFFCKLLHIYTYVLFRLSIYFLLFTFSF